MNPVTRTVYTLSSATRFQRLNGIVFATPDNGVLNSNLFFLIRLRLNQFCFFLFRPEKKVLFAVLFLCRPVRLPVCLLHLAY